MPNLLQTAPVVTIPQGVTTPDAALLHDTAQRPGAHAPVPEFTYDVAIVGLGYVGLPTALAYHHSGARVLAFDISAHRMAEIRENRADLLDSDHARLATALDDEGFTLTDDVSALSQAAAVVICVPTPVDRHLVPDLTILEAACRSAVLAAVPGQLHMLTSTTYVGCTRDLLVQPLVERGFTPGDDVFVTFSAERIDPGNTAVTQEQVPRVVGGATSACEERGAELLGRYASVHRVHDLGAAEMTKLLENTFRAVNIALANEFADICAKLELKVTDVIDAAATKPYGFMRFMPGPGVGGHCIPTDPHYLLWQLAEQRIEAPLIAQAMSAIATRPGKVVERARDLLAERGLSLRDAHVLVVGVSYKPDVADLRESPALEILGDLKSHGSVARYHDAHFEQITLPTGHVQDHVADPHAFQPDLVILHTRHRDADLSWITDEHLVLDATYRESSSENHVQL